MTDEERVLDAIKHKDALEFISIDEDCVSGVVRSFTGNKKYAVMFNNETFSCGCTYFNVHKAFCKHLCLLAIKAYQVEKDVINMLLKLQEVKNNEP
jgi:hypothetical protein